MGVPRLWIVACAIALFWALNGAAAAGARTLNFGSGAWSWFADPRAIHWQGAKHQTYFGYVDRRGRVTIASYDRQGNRARTVLKNFRESDDHDNPALLALPSGRIAAFFSHHSAHYFSYRVSRRPEDLSTFGPRIRIRTNTAGRLGYTYPNPVRLRTEGNVIYLFWRGGNWMPTFSRMFPGGRFRRARTLIQGRPGQRPYMKVATNGRGTIAFAFTTSHPRERPSSLYFVKYRKGWLRAPSGRRLKRLRRAPIRLRRTSLVHSFRRTGQRAWVHDVALTRKGRPVIVYAAYGQPARRRAAYYYAVWTGRRWARHRIVGAGGPITWVPRERFYSGGISLNKRNPRVVYLSRQVGCCHQIEKWRTRSGGKNWIRKRLSRGATGNYRPIAPHGLHGDEDDILWMRGSYNRYENFFTSIFARLRSTRASSRARATFHVATAGRTLRVDASRARGTVRSWSFGDGTRADGRRATHRYRRRGTYFPRLTVTDASGRTDTLAVEVRIR